MKKQIYQLKVVSGKGRGRKIGIPTINLLIPKNFDLEIGIYACWVRLLSGKTTSASEAMMGALHYGPIPTFAEEAYSLEVHLIDQKSQFDPDRVEVEIVSYLRPIWAFPNKRSLLAQIEQDIETTRKLLTGLS